MPYTYPDEDFCIFAANYPYDRSISIILLLINDYAYVPNCTCTMIWILKNAALFNFQFDNSMCASEFNSIYDFKTAFDACSFPAKHAKCQMNLTLMNQSFASYSDSYFQFYDAQFILIEIRDALKSYLDYWLLFAGFSTNLVTVIVLVNAFRKAASSVYSNNKDNQLASIKENFFTYMLINSIINCAYCLMMFVNETFPCVPKPGFTYEQTTCLTTETCIATTASVLKLS
jgi:hypothetical protein